MWNKIKRLFGFGEPQLTIVVHVNKQGEWMASTPYAHYNHGYGETREKALEALQKNIDAETWTEESRFIITKEKS